MALTTTITPYDVALVLGQPAPSAGDLRDQQWGRWIGDALMLIQQRATDLSIPDTAVSQAKLDYAIREVVADYVRRVDPKRDPQLYFRPRTVDDFWALLGIVPKGGAFSLDTLGNNSLHLPWCSLYFGGTACSCGVDIAGYPIFEGVDDW